MKTYLPVFLLSILAFNLYASDKITIRAGRYGRSMPPEIMQLINKVFINNCRGAIEQAKSSPQHPFISFVDSYNSYDVEVVYDSRFPDDMVAKFRFDYTLGGNLPTKILIQDAYDSSHCDVGWHKVD